MIYTIGELNMIIISLGLALYIGFIYFYPELYINELAISFLPYILWFSIFWFLVLLICFFMKKGRSKKIIYAVLLALFGILSGLFLADFRWFYNNNGFPYSDDWSNISANIEELQWVKILYANVLYVNKNFEDFLDSIEDVDADILSFVEFTDGHMEDFVEKGFLEKYPYTNTVIWSKDVYWTVFENIVFSKYPLVNVNSTQQEWFWRYSYVGIDLWEEILYLYVIHTASPYSYYFFENRNGHLEKIANDIKKNNQLIPDNSNVVVVGDFNTSPWSYFYKKFEKEIDPYLYNIAKQKFSVFTWNVLFMFTQIDHAFVSDNIVVENMEIFDVIGSDHNWILFDIKV